MGQIDSETKNINDNEIGCDTIKCFASMAESIHPNEREKTENLSNIPRGHIKDKHPESLKNKRLKVRLDSGCSDTLVNKRAFDHLETAEQKLLLKPVQIEDLFDGSLGTWKTAPIQLELKRTKCKTISC